ncbi:MAG: hypothetical protein ACXWVZ_01985 [Kaistella sp.]
MFLCIYLLSFTEVRQLLKFPNLVEHYVFHKISSENTTLFSFLKLHYLDENRVDSDYDQDMKLPFKTHEANTYSMISLWIPDSFRFVIKVPEIFRKKVPIFSYSTNYASNPLASIFRPPILI